MVTDLTPRPPEDDEDEEDDEEELSGPFSLSYQARDEFEYEDHKLLNAVRERIRQTPAPKYNEQEVRIEQDDKS